MIMTTYIQSMIHVLLTSTIDRKITLQYFPVILKPTLQNCRKILQKCFIGTACAVILQQSKIFNHTLILSVAKEIKKGYPFFMLTILRRVTHYYVMLLFPI